MKISGHRTEAMFKRDADIFTDEDTAAAILKAEAYLDTQPTDRNAFEMPVAKRSSWKKPYVWPYVFAESPAKVGSSGRIRTENQRPTPADSNLPDPELNAT